MSSKKRNKAKPQRSNAQPKAPRRSAASEPAAPAGRWSTIALFAGILIIAGVAYKIFGPSTPVTSAGATNSATIKPLANAGGTNASGGTDDAALLAVPDRDKAVAFANQGNQFLTNGAFAEAIQSFQAAIAITPEDEDLHYDLGIAYAQLGKTNEAVKAYEKALELFSDYAEVHNNLGNLLMKMGRLDEAQKHFEEAVKNSPENGSFRNNLGSLLARRGQIPEALLHFSKAVELAPNNFEAHFNLGNAYLYQNRAEEAAKEFAEALRLNPGFEMARRNLDMARRRK